MIVDKVWDEILRAADDDYELTSDDRENMMNHDSVSFLVGRGFYRLALEVWFESPRDLAAITNHD